MACQPSRQELAAEHRATLAQFCFDCHNDVGRSQLIGAISTASRRFDASDVDLAHCIIASNARLAAAATIAFQ